MPTSTVQRLLRLVAEVQRRRPLRRRDLAAGGGAGGEAARDRAPQPGHRVRARARLRPDPLDRGLPGRRSAEHYDTLTPYIERTLRGEANVLTAERRSCSPRRAGRPGSAEVHPGDAELPARVQPRRPCPHLPDPRRLPRHPRRARSSSPSSNDIEGHSRAASPTARSPAT